MKCALHKYSFDCYSMELKKIFPAQFIVHEYTLSEQRFISGICCADFDKRFHI